eukprot:g2358.t1
MNHIITTFKPRVFVRRGGLSIETRSRVVRCRAQRSTKPPSMRPSATELESLERLSTVVPDTILQKEVSLLDKPKAATVSAGVLISILNSQTSFPEYKNAVEKGFAYSRDPKLQLNKAFANVGALFAKEVSGRVSTQLDPRSAHDTNTLVRQAKALMKLYTEMDIPEDKLIFQVPATWQGICAVNSLERDGICTLVEHVFSFCQAVAAAQRGASAILVNMGLVEDWYRQHPGAIRDPTGPREDAVRTDDIHPGYELVKKIFSYCKKQHPETRIMVSGVRTREDALAVAGVDYIVLGPKVIHQLNEVPTAEGYNYDLSGTSANFPVLGVEDRLTPAAGLETDDELPLDKVTEEHFSECLGYAGTDLLNQSITRSTDNINRLIPMLSTMAMEDSERRIVPINGTEECSTSTSEALCEIEQPNRAMTVILRTPIDPNAPPKQTSDRKALEKMQLALRSKISELETVEAEEKETLKATKKAVREVQRILSNKELSMGSKLDQFQQKYLQQVNEQMKVEKLHSQTQKKLDKITAEKLAIGEEVRRLSTMNSKLQDLCRTLQSQNKTIVQEAQDRAAEEASQREQLSRRLESSMKEISSKLEDHSAESQKCIMENTELRTKLKEISRFCDEKDQHHEAQLSRKDVQINFLQERLNEQAELVQHYEKAEILLQEKCKTSEEAKESFAKQLENAKEKITGFCTSFEQSNKAFKQLQSQLDMSNKIQKKLQQESELLKQRSDLVQKKSEKVVTENEKLTEQVDSMRAKLEESVTITEHKKIKSQKEALEKLCRALQGEIQQFRNSQQTNNETNIAAAVSPSS